jgi:hypothetical protein
MDYRVLWDYADALHKESFRLSAVGQTEKAMDYERYADALNASAAHHRHKTIPSRDDAASYVAALMRASSPYKIEQLVPEHWQADTSKAVYAIAASMERAARGKPPRRLFGLLD